MSNDKFEKLIVILMAVIAIAWCGWFILTQTTYLGPEDMQAAAATPKSTATPTPVPTPTPTPSPAPTPTATPDPLQTRAQEILNGMTLEEKVWQLFVATPEEVAGVSNVTVSKDGMKKGLEATPVGGLVYDSDNFVDADQVTAMTTGAQSLSSLGLFIACDEESGSTSPLAKILTSSISDDMIQYKDDGADKAYSNANTIATGMAALGFNVDFAPVADVYSDSANDTIGARCYSDDFSTAADLVASAVKGFADGKVIPVLTHFPGIGEANGKDLTLSTSLDDLRKNEFQPFVSGMNAGAGMVMVSSVTVSNVEDVPTCLSPKLVTDVLRNELKWNGVVITDELSGSAFKNITQGDAAVEAIQAGADMILAPEDLGAAGQAILTAVNNGDLSVDRINESVARILYLKLQEGIIQ